MTTRLGYQRPLDTGLGIYSARTMDKGTDDERLEEIASGTLTCLATRESDKKRVLLTCLHVMAAGMRNAQGNEEMYQGGHEATHKVGSSVQPIELVVTDNYADAAASEPVKRMIVPGVTDPLVPVSGNDVMTLTLFGSD